MKDSMLLPQGSVLIVDDDANMREVIRRALSSLGIDLHVAASAEQAFEILANENIDVILSDFRMQGINGLDFLRRVRVERLAPHFVLFTGYGCMDTVIQAFRLGASDFICKPFDNDDLRAIVKRHLNLPSVSILAPGLPVPNDPAAAGLLGRSRLFLTSLETAHKAAQADSPVLITGESGTGKEGFARYIHESSEQRKGPFIAVNCGAIPENLIESELFGYVRGAFTGAIADRPGKFALADGGTLFLDEIGEMPVAMQVRLLRVLQEHVVDPLGGGASVHTNFRVIAATNRDLREDVRSGRFREDLWFRLHVIPIALPPLRDRERDVILLARSFLSHYNGRYGTSLMLTPENERTLMAHMWPGNVRELANAMERAVVLSEGPLLTLELDRTQGGAAGEAEIADHSVRAHRRAAEREVILAALETCRWNKTQTAERLGISRRGLLYKIKEYGIK